MVGPMQEMGYAVETPMEGLKFGQQLRWLNGQLEGGRDDER